MVQMIKSLLNGKYEITIPKHRADRPEWYTDTGWERERLDSIHSKLTQGDIVYYVGAEEGEMAALCQIWGAEVILFEPNNLVWPNIKSIWEANNLDAPLAIFNGFAANKDYKVAENFMRIWPQSANGEVIGNHGFKELADPGDIAQVKIDTIVNIYGTIPTAISLDVEGSEWEVLRGAEQTLNKYKPKIWLSGHPEFLYIHFGEYLGDLRAWIKNIGYKETLLDYQHEVHFYYE